MKMYFAGDECGSLTLRKEKVNKLFSYYYLKDETQLQKAKLTFLDSGGFSAFTKGAKINIDDYCNYIKKNKEYITHYAQLDVIGDEAGTEHNQRYMESKGLNPLPVFHFKGDFKRLERLSKEYQYICLGGLVPLAKKKDILKRHLDKCFSIIKNNCKVHGFGMTGFEILKRYPWHSVDSTSWLQGGRFGNIVKFNHLNSVGFDSYNCNDNKHIKKLRDIQFKSNYKVRNGNNQIEYQKLEKYITKLWQKKGIQW